MEDSELIGKHSATAADEMEFTRATLRELRDMAAGRRNEMLKYLIEMAYIEVSDQLRASHQERAAIGKVA